MFNEPKVLNVIRIGHPTLAKRAQEVEDPTSLEIQTIVKSLEMTLAALGGGAGLAAPQVNISLRLFVFCLPEDRSEDGKEIPLSAIINPVIEYKSVEMESCWEGCFSVPNMMGEVSRAKKIRYRYQTLTGETKICEAQGLHARIIQHESDHLDGIIYLQRMQDMRRFGYIDEIRNYQINADDLVDEDAL